MKAKIRKTGEIVDIIDYYVNRSELDWVSYVDSKGREHYREDGNRCLDFEPIVEPIKQSDYDSHWQDVRERAAIAALQGIIAHAGRNNNAQSYTQYAVGYADSLVEELKKK